MIEFYVIKQGQNGKEQFIQISKHLTFETEETFSTFFNKFIEPLCYIGFFSRYKTLVNAIDQHSEQYIAKCKLLFTGRHKLNEKYDGNNIKIRVDDTSIFLSEIDDGANSKSIVSYLISWNGSTIPELQKLYLLSKVEISKNIQEKIDKILNEEANDDIFFV